VKEIYDECWNIRKNRKDCVIFNQFDEFGNPCWHYNVTGPALEQVFNKMKKQKSRLAAYVSATGSAGTIAAGDYLKTLYPNMKITASEALQCPTLLMNGFGGHRIEGIGDKHVPWIHNVRNTDLVTAIDDEDCMRILRLFNEPEGKEILSSLGVNDEIISRLGLLGISGIGNLLSAIKIAKYYELTSDDVILTIATDAADMYTSRLGELSSDYGPYTKLQATLDKGKCLDGTRADTMKELTYNDRKAIHNLKYFTWVEQQGKEIADLNRLWYDQDFWPEMFAMTDLWDKMIVEFNALSK
jgi:hypothetical protein